MQPDDQKVDFQKPQETNYFSPAPTQVTPETPVSAPAPEAAPAATANVPLQAVTTESVPSSEGGVVQTEAPAEVAETTDPVSSDLPTQEPVQWQAPEYLHHEKNPLWFIGFGVVVVILSLAAIFLIKSWTFAILIPVMAAALIAYSHRPPHIMDYVVSGKGIYINDTLHPFAEFKSFGVIHDDEEYSVAFIPVRRFRPSLTVYFPEDKGEDIVDFLGVRLPMQPLKLDAFDKIVRFLGL